MTRNRCQVRPDVVVCIPATGALIVPPSVWLTKCGLRREPDVLDQMKRPTPFTFAIAAQIHVSHSPAIIRLLDRRLLPSCRQRRSQRPRKRLEPPLVPRFFPKFAFCSHTPDSNLSDSGNRFRSFDQIGGALRTSSSRANDPILGSLAESMALARVIPASGSNFPLFRRNQFPLSEILRNLPWFNGAVRQLPDFGSVRPKSAESWRAQGASRNVPTLRALSPYRIREDIQGTLLLPDKGFGSRVAAFQAPEA